MVNYILKYNFSTFERGENPLFDGWALFISLGLYEPSIRLNVMYYERRRHYNPILNIKSCYTQSNILRCSRGGYCFTFNMGYRKDTSHRYTKKCSRCYATSSCESSASLITIGAKCVIVRFTSCFVYFRNIIARKNPTTSNLQAFANR